VGVQEVRCKGGATVLAEEYTFFNGKENYNHELGTGSLKQKRSQQLRGLSLSRMHNASCIILRGRWCHIIVLNIHAPKKCEIVNMKVTLYKELEGMFDKFSKYHMEILLGDFLIYHMKILLGDFNAEVGKEDIFKPTIGNKSLHEISNNNELD
jgi:hypothetical protein